MESRAVHHQARRHLAQHLELDQAVFAQGAAGLHDVDRHLGEVEQGRQLDRAGKLEDLGAPVLLGENAAGGVGVFRSEPHLRARAGQGAGAADQRKPAAAGEQARRHQKIAALLLEHVAADDAEVGDAVFDVERQVAVLEQQNLEAFLGKLEPQPAVVVGEPLERVAGRPEGGQRGDDVAPLGQGQADHEEGPSSAAPRSSRRSMANEKPQAVTRAPSRSKSRS